MLALAALFVVGGDRPAAAAGAESATITGPGLDAPIEALTEVPELSRLTGAWFAAVADDVEPLMTKAPTDALGRRFILTWVMLGPTAVAPEQRSIVQELYPDAEGGPVVHTPAGQSLAGEELWSGSYGWYRAPKRLHSALAELGLPISDAGSDGDAAGSEEKGSWPLVVVASLVGAAALAVGWKVTAERRSGAAGNTSS